MGAVERPAVDLRHDELAEATVGDERSERAEGDLEDLRVVAGSEDLERGPAPFQVERGVAVDEDGVGACGTLQRPPIVLTAARPRHTTIASS